MAAGDPDRARVEAKLPLILVAGTTEKEDFNEYRRMDYHLRHLKKTNPALYNHHVNAITVAAAALKACLIGIQTGRDPQDVIVEWGLSAVKRESERQRVKTIQ